jgi:hypothetical protein
MTDPISNLAQYLWSHGGEIWINVIAILISAGVGWIIYSLLRRIAKKAEDSLERIPERLGGKTCPRCHGVKAVECTDCAGKGSNSKTVQKDVVCSACKGTKKIEVNCPECNGRGTKARRLLYKALGISAETRFSIIPFGHYEYVTVRIQNSDIATGTYFVRATLADASTSSSRVGRSLASGAAGTFSFEFKVRGSTCYPASFEVEPPEVVEPCDRCKGGKRITIDCPECSGTGSIPQTTLLEEPCIVCAGKGILKCPECKGEGRLAGLFG